MKKLTLALILTVSLSIASKLPAEVENSTAAFKIEGDKYTSVTFAYYKSVNLMVKLSVEADTTLLTPMEFGYCSGGIESGLLETLVKLQYITVYGEEAAKNVDFTNVKSMRIPFEKPALEFSFMLTENNIIITTLVKSGGEENSTKKTFTWLELFNTQ